MSDSILSLNFNQEVFDQILKAEPYLRDEFILQSGRFIETSMKLIAFSKGMTPVPEDQAEMKRRGTDCFREDRDNALLNATECLVEANALAIQKGLAPVYAGELDTSNERLCTQLVTLASVEAGNKDKGREHHHHHH